jgi:hypothetical protein
MLAFGTMSVAAGVIAVLKLLAGWTTIDLSPQALGAAVLNGPHGLTMRGQEFVGILFSVVSPIFSKEVGQF